MGDDLLTPRERKALEANPEAELNFPENLEGYGGPDLHGVGGWLALLVAVLLVIGPVRSGAQVATEISEIEGLYPELAGTTAFEQAVTLDWTVFFIQAAVSIGAGILLLKRHLPSTVPIVIGLIWVNAIVLSSVSVVAAGHIFDFQPTGSDFAMQLGPPIVFSTIWTLYLVLSRRVKNTYSAETHSH